MSTLFGGVSRQSHAAAFPPDCYYCLLDELPLHLLPRTVDSRLRNENTTELYLNAACKLLPADKLPEAFAYQKDIFSAFALQGTIALVRDERTGACLPFWLDRRLEKAVQGLRLNEPVLASMPQEVRSVLAAAGILLPRLQSEQAAPETQDWISKARMSYREKGYAPLSGLIHPFHVAALRRYYRCLIRKGKIRLGDEQSSLRYVAHNEPVARFFHQQIALALSAVAGQPLQPSYVYMASYLSGAELKKHVDREQCEFSITLCLDFSPEPELSTPWPICLDSANGKVVVYQGLGDGLAYRGTRLPHYREKLGPGQTSTSIFFHYVSADFQGRLD
ncbi:MAG TPA: hypothetical protein VKB49_10155 [Candidatus Sulfotelmatobacter sp.]|nr:hypothetical protein [Candidatus Sulfotelmatobacter sp.]